MSNQPTANDVAVAGEGADPRVGGSSGLGTDKPGIDVGKVTERLFYALPGKTPEVNREEWCIRRPPVRLRITFKLMRS